MGRDIRCRRRHWLLQEHRRTHLTAAGRLRRPFFEQSFKRDVEDWAGSASIKHKPSGLFAFSAFSFSETHDTNTIHSGFYTGSSAPQMNGWDVEAGIQRDFAFLGLRKLGETSFWGAMSG
jgi:hypothetical protein